MKALGSIEAQHTDENCFSGMQEVETIKGEAEGVFILSSSAADETSRELSDCQHKLGKEMASHDHGAFTFHLLEGLYGLAGGEGGDISVKTLRDYIDEHGRNPNQTFKLFSSRESNAGRIILAHATDMVELSASLAKVEEYLKSGDYPNFFMAADALSGVLKNRPNYQAAKDLKSQLEKGLATCRQKSLVWLNKYKFPTLMQQDRLLCDSLQAFLTQLSLEQIERYKRDAMLGVAITLVEAAQGDWPVERLLPFFLSREPPEPPPSSPLKTQLKGSARGTQ
jgi:hypothetical protein